MTDSIQVDPYDIAGMARAFYRASVTDSPQVAVEAVLEAATRRFGLVYGQPILRSRIPKRG